MKNYDPNLLDIGLVGACRHYRGFLLKVDTASNVVVVVGLNKIAENVIKIAMRQIIESFFFQTRLKSSPFERCG